MNGRKAVIFAALVVSSAAFGHSDGLDSYGCHHNRKAGGYHCHRGDNAGQSYSSQSEMLRSRGPTQNNASEQLASIRVIQGKVVAITDGDTATILMNNTQYKVRLAEIDTPERGQAYGSRAREALSALIFGKEVTARVQDVDRYGRYVARVYAGEVDVSREMVSQGAAWVYRQYLRDQLLLRVEQQAKEARRGLWSLPEAEKVPPWEWRSGSNQSLSPAAIPPMQGDASSQGPSCASKRYCGQMSSCDEAMFYLKSCGLYRLDGDRDGVPCEALCR